MKLRIKQHTLTALNNLKGLWLLCGGDIIIIRDFQYTQETVTPETKKKKHYFTFSSDVKEPERRTYLIDITVEGYHQDLKFVGTYNEEYCERLISQHDSSAYTLNLIEYRKAWTELEEQIEAFTACEKEKAASTEPVEENK